MERICCLKKDIEYTYVGPALHLYPDGHGRFEYSGLASDWPAGEYEISGENLILKDDFTDQIYTFKIDGSQLIFCADKSGELYDYGDGTAELLDTIPEFRFYNGVYGIRTLIHSAANAHKMGLF